MLVSAVEGYAEGALKHVVSPFLFQRLLLQFFLTWDSCPVLGATCLES